MTRHQQDDEPPLVHPERLSAPPDERTVVDADLSWLTGPPLKPRELMAAYGLERMCERIAEGITHTELAADIGVSSGALSYWFSGTPERQAAIKEARRLSAQAFDEQALQAIRGAKDFLTLGIAREEASHLRWRAKAVAPREYGDRQHIDLDAKVQMTPEQAEAKVLALSERARQLGGAA